MGYLINDIAKVSKEPKIICLAGNSNFVQFEAKKGEPKRVDIKINIIGVGMYGDKKPSDPNKYNLVNVSEFVIEETKTGIKHTFKGTPSRDDVGNNIFYLGQVDYNPIFQTQPIFYGTKEDVSESMLQAFRSNSFLSGSFNMIIPPIENEDGSLSKGSTIYITSKGAGNEYSFTMKPTDIKANEYLYTIEGDSTDTNEDDSILDKDNEVNIELDIFRDTNVFLGEDSKPTISNIGTHVHTMIKSYFRKPIWFDLNAMGLNKYSTDFLNNDGWIDTGTLIDIRFSAKRVTDRNIASTFYYSDVLYLLSGYTRELGNNNLSEYVYDTIDNNLFKPLTKQPVLFHIKGQTQYFNFIIYDPDRNINLGEEYNLGVMYKLYTQSRRLVDTVVRHEQNRKLFNMVNTIKLDIDGATTEYENIGYIEICLCRSGEQISEPLKFTILPDCLYKVNDFAFLNSLGGWSSFNFAGTETTDFKSSSSIMNKAKTPDYTISSEIESVYSKEIEEKFIVQTMPVNEAVCNWLKELSSSIAVYELSTKRYVIVDELNIKPNSKDELFRLEMKYHYSDSYNGLIK